MQDFDWEIIWNLYQEKNITRTAEKLFVTQSALTKRIQKIEEQLQATIIIRNAKGISFTPEGEHIALCAREILKITEEMKTFIVESADSRRHRIHVGASNSYINFYLPSIINGYRKIRPDVHLDISSAHSHDILHLAQDGAVDIGFVRGEFVSYLKKVLISTEQIYVVSRDPIDFQELPHLPMIEFPKEPTVLAATKKWWDQNYKQEPYIYMRVNNGDACYRMILEGLGYGIFPDIAFVSLAGNNELTKIPLYFKDGSAFTRHTWMVYQPDAEKDSVLRSFINYVIDHKPV